MALSRRLARPLLASIFVAGGLDALRDPAAKAKKASAVTEPLQGSVQATAQLDTETLVRINGGVQVVAGLLLATGRFRRLASLVLMGSLVPTTYAGHRFWEETDDAARTQQRMHFVKNLGLLGGLILAAVDTEGEPSLGWRTRRRIQTLQHGSQDVGARSKAGVQSLSAIAAAASKSGSGGAKRARRTVRRVRRRARDTGFDLAHKAADVREGVHDAQGVMAATIQGVGGGAAHALQQTGASLTTAAHQLEPLAEGPLNIGVEGIERAGEALTKVGDRLPTY